MAKEEKAEKAEKKDDARMARWHALVEQFKKERPLAYEARKDTGEFDNPPADFI